MRQKRDAVLSFEWSGEAALKIVRDRRKGYKKISALLDKNPAVLDLAHRDLLELLSEGGPDGRTADFTSENLLRALIVHQIEGEGYRETVILIAESPFLEDFLRLGPRPVMDFTFLCRAFGAIRDETWQRINALFAVYARDHKRIDPSAIRVDTTVVETTIHYPTDSSLWWDGWRLLARSLKEAHRFSHELCPHRFHNRKVKKLHLYITRYAKSKAASRQRDVKTWWRTLIERVAWIVGVAEEFLGRSAGHPDPEVPAAEVREALEARVGTLAIPRKLSDWSGKIGPLWQRFRAGIEGTISVLKRAYRLLRCPYRGFKHFASSVGLSIFCHSLVLLADWPGG